MQDKDYHRLMKDPLSAEWAHEVIFDLAAMAHTSNHHSTYTGGALEFMDCGLRMCKLAQRAAGLVGHDPALAYEPNKAPIVLPEDGAQYQVVACPKGHTEHIVQLTHPQNFGHDAWHCDDCHENFVFQPEARPFGGLSNSEFKRTLARYVQEQGRGRATYSDQITLLNAAAMIDPDIGPEEWKQMVGGMLGDPSAVQE